VLDKNAGMSCGVPEGAVNTMEDQLSKKWIVVEGYWPWWKCMCEYGNGQL